jgi:hypothetical protein
VHEDVQPAKIPFLPLLEKVAERFVLYGVLSLLNRICAKDKGVPASSEKCGTHISVDSVNDVLGR